MPTPLLRQKHFAYWMLEVESLGPLQHIAPSKSIEHIERWRLLKGLPNETTDAAIDANLRSRVETLVKN